MKNSFLAILIIIFVFPAFLPFTPHSAVHTLYEAHAAHHGNTSNHSQTKIEHSHINTADHAPPTDENVHHGVPTDIESYYSDFLHVDLRNADADLLVPLINLDQNIDYDALAGITAQNRYELASFLSRAPPDTHVYNQDYSSLYLTTLRLRI